MANQLLTNHIGKGSGAYGKGARLEARSLERGPSHSQKGPTSHKQVLLDLDLIRRADLGPWRTITAQLMLCVRNFAIDQGDSLKPIQEWTVDDVITASEGVR